MPEINGNLIGLGSKTRANSALKKVELGQHREAPIPKSDRACEKALENYRRYEAQMESMFKDLAEERSADPEVQSRIVRELRDWIQREIHLSLAQAPFDVNDPNLLPAAGACTTCPKRSGSNPLLFADTIKRPDVCTDPECFKQKLDILVARRTEELEKSGEKPLKVSDSHLFYGQKPLPGVIYRPDYYEATAGDCPNTTVAVIVEGKRAGTKLYVCTNKRCKTHADPSVGLSPEEKAERKKQAAAVRIQQEYRKRLLEEIYKRVPSGLSRHELDLIALNHFHQLGHDSQHRLFKFFAWEVPKTNASSGGYVDYQKLVSGKLEAMSAAEIGRFLMVCALASNLYCPSYLSDAALGKDSDLAKEAVQYKVNATRILREARERLTKKSLKQNSHSKPHLSPAPKR